MDGPARSGPEHHASQQRPSPQQPGARTALPAPPVLPPLDHPAALLTVTAPGPARGGLNVTFSKSTNGSSPSATVSDAPAGVGGDPGGVDGGHARAQATVAPHLASIQPHTASRASTPCSDASRFSEDHAHARAPSKDLARSQTFVVAKPQPTVSNKVRYNFHEVVRLTGSVVPRILVPSLLLSLWAAFWTTVFIHLNWQVGIQSTLITILSVVISLLLVFRTNTAYDRYWEARRTWGTLFTHTRNLGRFTWVCVESPTYEDLVIKHGTMNLLVAFAVATKHYLREEPGHHYEDLHNLLIHLPEYAPGAMHPNVENLPLEISYHISSYISRCRRSGYIDVPTANSMMGSLSGMIDCLSNAERIRNSPIPLAYSIHLKQTLFLYILSLPFQIVSAMGWVTIPIVFVASFTLLGIETIGGEIENPFGYDENDLDLDQFCDMIKRELQRVVDRPTSLDPKLWTLPVQIGDFDHLIRLNKSRSTLQKTKPSSEP
ncbi:hypothetical protein HK105_202311 [Polyrhizophydium stewartii]|uniref:Uncharacterized protein n=1 Tax=Polyrhizophydium stewartii TaxID=2732419 RepID=A0ABR4NEE7_9FUNG|nr:hypothetical protein HK105_006413 [Polyrhizophydium stewartii]